THGLCRPHSATVTFLNGTISDISKWWTHSPSHAPSRHLDDRHVNRVILGECIETLKLRPDPVFETIPWERSRKRFSSPKNHQASRLKSVDHAINIGADLKPGKLSRSVVNHVPIDRK